MRWVAPENLHYTLKFLGDIAPDIVRPLGDSLTELALQTNPFEMRVGRLGAFPNLQAPRVLWVGLTGGENELSALAREVSSRVKLFPTQADNKPFKPHLTIGRAREAHQRIVLPESLLQASFGEMRCDRIILMQSTLTPKGSLYSPLAEAKFAS